MPTREQELVWEMTRRNQDRALKDRQIRVLDLQEKDLERTGFFKTTFILCVWGALTIMAQCYNLL